jgi:DNA-binding response OmpR family regulator
MNEQHSPVPVLVGQGGPLNGYRWNITDQLVIGRAEECSITISNQQVSRRHARLTRRSAQVTLTDLSSKNGTFLNGNPVREDIQLQEGDQIQIALAQEFIFLSQDATVPLEADHFEGSPLSIKPELRLDPDSHRVWVGQIEVKPPLSALQFKLLNLLYTHMGHVVTREEIIDRVWGESAAAGVTDQALDALIRRLRDRLSEVFPGHNFIITVRGQGFRLDTQL